MDFLCCVSFVIHASPRSRFWQGIPGLCPPRLCKQLQRTLQLPLESLDTASARFGMGLAYCPGGVEQQQQEFKARLPVP